MPLVEVKLTTQDTLSHTLKEKWALKLRSLLGAHVLEGYPSSMANEVVQLLSRHALTLTTAESCTGGLISSQITSIPGASTVFEGGVVSYSNTMKKNLLNVKPETLNHSQCLYLPGTRTYFQQFVAAAALDLIRREVMGVSETPMWFKRI